MNFTQSLNIVQSLNFTQSLNLTQSSNFTQSLNFAVYHFIIFLSFYHFWFLDFLNVFNVCQGSEGSTFRLDGIALYQHNGSHYVAMIRHPSRSGEFVIVNDMRARNSIRVILLHRIIHCTGSISRSFCVCYRQELVGFELAKDYIIKSALQPRMLIYCKHGQPSNEPPLSSVVPPILTFIIFVSFSIF